MDLNYVYLAGPISGLSWEEATGWRDYAKKNFLPHVVGLSPLRGKEYLASEQAIGKTYPKTLMSNSRAINSRDRFDTRRADLVLMNLLGCKTVTVGTMIEVGWANMAGVPIVLVMEASGNVHEHPMVRECAGFFAETVEDGVALVNAVLSRA